MSDRRNLVRTEIMLDCYGHGSLARGAEQIVKLMKLNASVPNPTVIEVEEEADRLVKMGYLVEIRVAHAPGEKRWEMTGAGIRYLEQEGIV